MAYMNQEKKARIAAALKAALAGSGVKYTLAVQNHSTIVCNIKSAPIDFIGNYNEVNAPKQAHNPHWTGSKGYIDVNPYWFREHFTGKALATLEKIFACLNEGNHNNSDSMTDYFDVGWYVDVNIGQWGKPYTLAA